MKHLRLLVLLALTLGLAASSSRRLAAQVGVRPTRSPYRDIQRGTGWTFMGGQVGGDGGPLGLSPNTGISYGLRFDARFSGLLQGFVGLEYLGLERMVLNPDDSVVNRFSGPIDAPVWIPAIGLQLNLTGPKTWRHIAPFAAVTFGAAIGEHSAEDTSAFDFGTKLLIAPSGGARIFIGQRIHMRVEAIWYMWKMKYPPDWLHEPDAEIPASGEPSNAPITDVDDLEDWITTPSLRLGLGIAF